MVGSGYWPGGTGAAVVVDVVSITYIVVGEGDAMAVVVVASDVGLGVGQRSSQSTFNAVGIHSHR